MPDVDYLRYAQLATQRNPFAEGLAGISQTLQTGRQQAMQEEQMRRAARLSDIQAKSGEATLAGTLAEQEGLQQAYGTENLPGAYAAKEKAAIQSAKQKQGMEKGALIKDMFDKTYSAVKSDVMTPEEAETFFRGTMKMSGIDFDQAGMKFSFSKKGGYYSGPINEQSLFMMNGKPVPFGDKGIVEKAHVVGVAPDGVSPIYEMDENTKFTAPTAEKAEETWGEPYAMTVGGKRAMVQKSSRGQIRPVVQDVGTTVKVSTGGGGAGKDFKNESAMRKEFLTLPEVKDFPTIQQSSKRALAALQEQGKGSNVAIDQSIITVFNKMLDPSSVVRESEYARTPQDLSILSRIKGKWDKVQRGGAGLDANERQALYRMINSFNTIANEQYNEQVDFYSGLAKRYGYRPENIVRLGGKRAPEEGAPGAPPAAIDMLKKNPSLRGKFDEKYGKGASAKVLGR